MTQLVFNSVFIALFLLGALLIWKDICAYNRLDDRITNGIMREEDRTHYRDLDLRRMMKTLGKDIVNTNAELVLQRGILDELLNASGGVWQTGNGTRVMIRTMSDLHLANALAYIDETGKHQEMRTDLRNEQRRRRYGRKLEDAAMQPVKLTGAYDEFIHQKMMPKEGVVEMRLSRKANLKPGDAVLLETIERNADDVKAALDASKLKTIGDLEHGQRLFWASNPKVVYVRNFNYDEEGNAAFVVVAEKGDDEFDNHSDRRDPCNRRVTHFDRDAVLGTRGFAEQPPRVDLGPLDTLNEWCRKGAEAMKANGFDCDVPTAIALMHSELSELLETYRKGTELNFCDKGIGLDNRSEECADLFLRLAHFCGAHEIDLADAVARKHAFNLTRPRKHGKKF